MINKGLQLFFFFFFPLIVNRQVLDHFLIQEPSEIPYSIPAPKWPHCAGKRSDSCGTETTHSEIKGCEPLSRFTRAEDSAVAT